jgi:serine/threonine protein kinase
MEENLIENYNQYHCIINEKFGVLRVLNNVDSICKILLAENLLTGESVVIKQLKQLYSRGAINRMLLTNEGQILKKLSNNENIIKIYDYSEQGIKCSKKTQLNKKIVYLVMEYAEKGDLFDFVLHSNKGFQENVYLHYFKQLIDTVSVLHNDGICHLDIKLENIFVQKDFQLKLGDFGFACKYLDDKGEKVKMKSRMGSEKYMAPELHQLHGKQKFYHGDKADIFSLGIVFLALISGTLFFEKANSSDYYFRMFCQQPQSFLKHYLIEKNVSEEVTDLIIKMLTLNFEERIGIKDILNHDVYKKCCEVEKTVEKSIISQMEEIWSRIPSK